MYDVCTEQHVGNAKCASPSFSLFFLLLARTHARTCARSLALPRSSFGRATLRLLRHGRVGRNINDQANHPERTSGRPPLAAEEKTEREKERVTALRAGQVSNRGGEGEEPDSFCRWRGGCVHGAARIPRRGSCEGDGGVGAVHETVDRDTALYEYGLTVFADGPSADQDATLLPPPLPPSLPPLYAPVARKPGWCGSFDRSDQVASGVCLRIIPRSRRNLCCDCNAIAYLGWR